MFSIPLQHTECVDKIWGQCHLQFKRSGILNISEDVGMNKAELLFSYITFNSLVHQYIFFLNSLSFIPPTSTTLKNTHACQQYMIISIISAYTVKPVLSDHV